MSQDKPSTFKVSIPQPRYVNIRADDFQIQNVTVNQECEAEKTETEIQA